MSDLTLGVDLSDAIARLAILKSSGEIVARGIAANRMPAIKESVKHAVSNAGGTIASVTVAFPTAVETVSDALATALGAATSKATPITAIAAGTASAIAEFHSGVAVGVKHLITFSIGDHVTAGVLIQGKPWVGAHGLASSVGWLALNPVEREDYRRYGGLEAEVASGGIVKRLVWRIKSGDQSQVADRVKGDLSKITAADIFQGARTGDGVSISVVRDTAKYIGMAVANMAAMFDPEMVVLGGIIASAGDIMLEAIRVETSRRLLPQQGEQVKVLLSTLGDDAVAIGAALASRRTRT